MTDQQRHCIFTLLYAVVLIDNHVKKVEVDLFFARIESFLRNVGFIEPLKAKTIISTWFVQNFKQILKEMKSETRDSFLLSLVEDLKFYPQREDVFDIMKEIAMSDKEYHEREKQFIDKVAEIWNIA